jgi:hypothetical protein
MRWHGISVPRWLAIGLGVLAGLGVCIKPHFLLILLLPELYWLLVYRRWKPILQVEVALVLGIGIFYLIHPFVIFPQQALAYYERLIHNATNYYRYWNAIPWYSILRSPEVYVGFIAVALAFLLTQPEKNTLQREFTRGVAMVVAGSVIAYLLQRRAFTYQYIHATYTLIILLVLIFIRLSTAYFKTRQLKVAALAIPFIGLGAMLYVDASHFLTEHRFLSTMTPPFHQLLQQDSESGDDILYLGFDLHRFTDFTVLNLWQRHGYPSAYPVIFEAGRLEQEGANVTIENLQTPIIQEYYETVIDDLQTYDVPIVVVSIQGGCGGFCETQPDMSLLQILVANPTIASFLTDHYESIGDSDGYAVYRRVGSSAVADNEQ